MLPLNLDAIPALWTLAEIICDFFFSDRIMSIFYFFFEFAFRPSRRCFSWHGEGTFLLSVFVGARSLCGDIFSLGALPEQTALRGGDRRRDRSRYPDSSRLDENKNVGIFTFCKPLIRSRLYVSKPPKSIRVSQMYTSWLSRQELEILMVRWRWSNSCWCRTPLCCRRETHCMFSSFCTFIG